MQKLTWRRIAEELTGRIASGELKPGARIESEEEMATRLNVSRHTAHRAMHELQRQGLVVRQRRWGTVVAEPRSQRETNRIAYLADFTSNLFQADIMNHVEHELEDGMRLLVATSRNDHEREAEQLKKLSEEVDGIICYPCDGDENAEAFLSLARSGFPLVLVDRAPRGCEELVVLTDNIRASREAVADLVSRGHTRIAFFGTNNDHAQSIRERFLGYREAIDGLGYDSKAYERWIPVRLDAYDPVMAQSISDALVAMRALPNPPTAAFCTQDWLAAGVLEACETLGLQVGVDFGVATYNDFGAGFFRQPWRLDRVIQQMQLVSSAAVARLRARIRGEEPSAGPVRVPAVFATAADARSILHSSLAAPHGATTR